MFCQACGAKNAVDARFCNKCGVSIAVAGTPGGPVHEPTQLGMGAVPASVPPPARGAPRAETRPTVQGGGGSMADVSLADIGVRSNGQAAAVLLAAVAVLMALGGLVAWLGFGSDAPPPTETGRAEPGDPFVIGAPVPQADFGERAAADAPAPTTPAAPAEAPSPARSSRRPRSERSPGPDPAPGPAAASTTPSPAPLGVPVSAAPSHPGAQHTTPAPAPAPAPDQEISTPDLEEGDLEVDLYAARVRFLVRRYYAARAQSCFDHATRNDPELHGQVVLAMTIAAGGEVSRAEVARNSTGDDALGRCLASQAATWRLSPPPGGSLDMEMPFSR